MGSICLLLSGASLSADQFDTLRSHWAGQLVGSNLSAATLAARASTANTNWSTLTPNSAGLYLWADLPLASASPNASYNIYETFSRLEDMALAWATPGCSLQSNANLAAAVAGGLDWMVANAYTVTSSEYPNGWWFWEVGAPQDLNNTAVLLYSALSGAQITNYCSVVDRFSPGGAGATYGWLTGANLTDQCKVVVVRGIVGRNSARMSLAQTNLSAVFPYVTSGDGFYRDGSFIQHTPIGPIAYTGTYGQVLLTDVAQLVNLLQGSTWQISDPNLTNVYNWVSNSFEPLIYNGVMMDMVRGRAVSRSWENEYGDGSAAISVIRQIAQFAPAATAVAFSNWANAPLLPSGQFHFADMDRVVALRSGFGFGLSMSSTRIANYESINGENLRGWFTGDGMTYLYVGSTDTQFTNDFWPTVDPYFLPGTTVETNPRADAANEGTRTSQNWVGGAQVARTYGVAGMSLAAVNTTLTAKKSWFMFDKEIVCLGAGITCGDAYGIVTPVENRRLGTSPTANLTVDGVVHPPTIGWSSNLAPVTWCSLDGVGGYYFPGGANLTAAFESRTHSWSEINSDGSANLLTDNYLKLYFNHGIKPINSTYAYVLLPNFTANNMSAYAANPDVDVLANSTAVQAASKPSIGVVAANFWSDGTSSADLITVNKKCSVITWETPSGISVGVADPTQTNTASITVTLNRSAVSTLSTDPGVTVVQLAPQIILSINVNGSAGKSYQAAFGYTKAPPNSAPRFTSAPVATTTIEAGTTLTLDLTATDADGDKLTFSLAGGPANASINPSSGVFTWTPTVAQQDSSYVFTVVVTDNGSPALSATETFTVVVKPAPNLVFTGAGLAGYTAVYPTLTNWTDGSWTGTVLFKVAAGNGNFNYYDLAVARVLNPGASPIKLALSGAPPAPLCLSSYPLPPSPELDISVTSPTSINCRFQQILGVGICDFWMGASAP